MRFFRVTADFLFDDEDEARDFFHDCENTCAKSIVIHEGDPNEERGHATLVDCGHDEDPNSPCLIIKEIWCPPYPPPVEPPPE